MVIKKGNGVLYIGRLQHRNFVYEKLSTFDTGNHVKVPRESCSNNQKIIQDRVPVLDNFLVVFVRGWGSQTSCLSKRNQATAKPTAYGISTARCAELARN